LGSIRSSAIIVVETRQVKIRENEKHDMVIRGVFACNLTNYELKSNNEEDLVEGSDRK